jgi:predicted dehydrogenase
MSDKLRVAVVGYGYWGPHMVRNFLEIDGAEVSAVCDARKDRLELVRRRHPSTATTTSFEQVVTDPWVDAVVLATPVSTHYPMVRLALESGKHVLVEKPLTNSVSEAEELVRLASRRGRVLMVDHTFLYTDAVQRLKRLIEADELGDLYYVDSVRVNLGLFQPDVSVVWDLATHDVSILQYLLGRTQRSVSATGSAHLKPGVQDVAYVSLMFDDSLIGHVHVSWLSPVKIRQTLIAGSRRMVVYNETEPSEKVRIYDRGVQSVEGPEDLYRLLVTYRMGDVYVPYLENREALRVECEHFVDCVRSGKGSISDGESSLAVVRVLEAAERSIQANGQAVPL